MKFDSKHNNKLIVFTSAISLVTFTIPFIIKSKDDSFGEVMSLAFTGVGTIASLLTLIIGLLILDVYGVKSKFKEREFDNVHKLKEVLREFRFSVEVEKGVYYLTPYEFSHLQKSKHYQVIKDKVVAFESEGYTKVLGNMTIWKHNDFIPDEIKEELNFLNIPILSEPEKNEDFVRIGIISLRAKEWLVPESRMTLDQFLTHFGTLAKKVEDQTSQYKVK